MSVTGRSGEAADGPAWTRLLRGRVPALLLLAGLLPGGLSTHELPILGAIVLLLATGGSPPTAGGAARPVLPRWAELGLVAYATGLTAWVCWRLPVQDQPLGTDWFNYLLNAIAIAEGNWAAYTDWRGPVHPWVLLALSRPLGGLLEAAQAVSGVSVTLVVPLTWLLGRRLLGPLPAALGTLLYATWPEWGFFGRMCTPYPLLTLLLVAGALVATLPGVGAALAAGGLLGLAIGTDVRGMGITAVIAGVSLLGPALAGPAQTGGRPSVEAVRRRVAPALALALVAFPLGKALEASIPVPIVPLHEQIALQRDLHATEGPGRSVGCQTRGMAFPTLGEVLGPCGRGTFRLNAERLAASLPASLPFYAALAALGLATRRAWPLVLPVLLMVPSLFLIGFQHRYGVALAPAVTLLFGAGLARLVGGRASLVGALLLVGALGLGLWRVPTAPLARATWGTSPHDAAPNVLILEPKGLTTVRQILREEARPGDHIVDCAKGGLEMRMYPTPVDEIPTRPGLLPEACRQLLASPPATRTWVLAVLKQGAPPGWEQKYALRRPEGQLLLLVGPR